MSSDTSQNETLNQPKTSSTVDEPIPTVWPGAFGLYKFSKSAVMFNIATFLGLIGFSILVSIASSFVSGEQTSSTDISSTFQMSGMGSLINIIAQLVGIWLSVAIAYVMIVSVKRQKMSVSESLREGGTIFLPFLGLNLLLGVITVASILLLLIPAFIILPRLVLAQYYLIEGKLGVFDSMSASWNATKGNVGKVWGIIGFNLLLVLLFITIIGIPFALYFGVMYQAAITVLYFFLKGQPAQTAPAAPVAPTGPVAPLQ